MNQRTDNATNSDTSKKKAYLVGGGIASLASAAYLIREGHLLGENIHIYEETGETGGSLDAQGSPETGYIMRGGRMFDEEAYTCMYDLLASIPSLRDPEKTVKQELFEFNQKMWTHSNSRLVEHGKRVDVSSPGFSQRDRLDLIRIMLVSEESLGTRRIEDCFAPSFFETNFWYMWCTTFAFQPWLFSIN